MPGLRKIHLLLLALILLLAASLRFFSISALGFWTDELCSLSAADGYGLQLDRIPVNQITPDMPRCTRLVDAKPFWHIPIAMAREDAHPPLYFMLLRLWEDIFGDDETAVRSLNVIFSLIAITLLYFAAAESVGSSTALVACLLMAVATPQIQYSQEARNYMPVLFFLLLAVIAVQRMSRSSAPIWPSLLGIALLAMMLTHYFAAGAAAGICLGAALTLRGRNRWIAIASIASAGAVFAILWVPSIIRQRTVFQNGLGWLSDTNPGHVQRRLIDLGRLPVRYFVEVTDPRAQPIIAAIGGCMLIAVLFLLLRRPGLRIWIFMLIGAIGIVAVADFTRSTTQLNWVRYSLFSTPAAYVLLAVAVRGRWSFALPALAIIASLVCLFNAYVPAWKIDFHTPVQMVAHLKDPRDGLIIIGPDPVADGIMYAAFKTYLPKMPQPTAVLTKPPTGDTLVNLQQCPHVWIVSLNGPPHIPGLKIQQQQSLPYAVITQGKIINQAGQRD